jgi:hypothetical protein
VWTEKNSNDSGQDAQMEDKMTEFVETINGLQYTRDNSTGLYSREFVAKINTPDSFFEKKIPEGYCLVDANVTAIKPSNNQAVWTVTIGTFRQVAALIPNCKFVPAEANVA